MSRILIIEDDRQLRAMLRQMLERRGCEITEAETGIRGIELYRQSPTDLVVIDMMIPGKDGLEVIRALKAEFPDIRVLGMSGGINQDVSWLMPIAATLGVTRFIKKPFSPTEFLGVLEEMLPQSTAQSASI